VDLLRQALERAGETPVLSKEPTNGQWGKIIKESASNGRLPLDEELDLFIRDRTEHVATLIGPALEQGKIVILDRYFYSSIAYQGARGADVTAVRSTMESRFPIPDAVFLLDIDPVLGIHRIANSRNEQPNHFEDRGSLALAREIFKDMNFANIHHVDGSMSRDSVHSRVLELFVDGALKSHRCFKAYGCDDPFHCVARITDTCEWVKMRRAMVHPEPTMP
jgi:dTMP kinase